MARILAFCDPCAPNRWTSSTINNWGGLNHAHALPFGERRMIVDEVFNFSTFMQNSTVTPISSAVSIHLGTTDFGQMTPTETPSCFAANRACNVLPVPVSLASRNPRQLRIASDINRMGSSW